MSGVAISLKFLIIEDYEFGFRCNWAITLVISFIDIRSWIGYKIGPFHDHAVFLIGSPCTASMRFGIKIGRKFADYSCII